MRGVVLKGHRQVEVQTFPDPVPGPDEVLIQTRVAAICGSDLHFYRDTPENLGPRTEMVVGHEPSGVVVAVGSCVRNVRVGDRVTVYHHIGCGTCAHCLAGDIMLCDQHVGIAAVGRGADADYVCVPARNCLPLPEGLSFVDGAFIACIAGTAYSALLKLAPSGRDTLAIFGLGPEGLVAGMMAKAFGSRVIGFELVGERLDLARRIGLDYVFDAGEVDPAAVVRGLTEGRGADGALETSGSPIAQVQAVRLVRKRGKVVFVGAGHEEPCIAPWWIMQREVTLMGTFVMPIYLYEDLVRFILRHRLDLEQVVTHRFSIEDAAEAFRLADSRRAGKILFVWE